MEILQNEVSLLILSGFVTYIVQKAKARKIAPMRALTVFSIFAGLIWFAINQYVPEDILKRGWLAIIEIAAIANLIYNMLKQYAPNMLQSGKHK